MSAPDDFLMGLFREEVASHSAVLTDGLLSLERQGCDRDAINPLMRAAHSIKGAAKVVDLAAVVKVAHEMEEVFVAAGEGKLVLDAVAVDTLLGALDWIVRLSLDEQPALSPENGDDPDAGMEVWAGKIRDCLGSAPQGGTAEAAPAMIQEVLNVAVESPAQVSRPDTVLAPDSELAATGSSESLNASSVRISAESLGRFLAYSADMLLESRRLQASFDTLRLIRKNPLRMASLLDAEAGSPEERRRLEPLLKELTGLIETHDARLSDVAGRMSFLSERLHTLALQSRMRPFSDGVQYFPRLVRDLARELGKQVHFTILGQSVFIDRDILAGLEAPINHLLRNALDHGLESPERRVEAGKQPEGRLQLEALHHCGRLRVTVEDDGHGIDGVALREKIIRQGLVTSDMAASLSESELHDFLFLPGLSTREEVSEVSGRGVGLDVVREMVHANGGSIHVDSTPGQGTRFELVLPITRSVLRALCVRVGEQVYALPLARVDRVLKLDPDRLESLNGSCYLATDRGRVTVVSLGGLLDEDVAPLPVVSSSLVLVSLENRVYAMEVDEVKGEYELVVRPLDPRLGKVPCVSSAALDDDGVPVLIMDIDDLVRAADRLAGNSRPSYYRHADVTPVLREKKILVVDDSITVRELERKLLENSGYRVDVAMDGVDGWNQVVSGHFDLVVTDVDMPHMNGIELVHRIRADVRLGGLPVIIVSYKDRPEDRLKGMEAGADYYLTKSSFHDSSLLDAVQTLIGEARQE